MLDTTRLVGLLKEVDTSFKFAQQIPQVQTEQPTFKEGDKVVFRDVRGNNLKLGILDRTTKDLNNKITEYEIMYAGMRMHVAPENVRLSVNDNEAAKWLQMGYDEATRLIKTTMLDENPELVFQLLLHNTTKILTKLYGMIGTQHGIDVSQVENNPLYPPHLFARSQYLMSGVHEAVRDHVSIDKFSQEDLMKIKQSVSPSDYMRLIHRYQFGKVPDSENMITSQIIERLGKLGKSDANWHDVIITMTAIHQHLGKDNFKKISPPIMKYLWGANKYWYFKAKINYIEPEFTEFEQMGLLDQFKERVSDGMGEYAITTYFDELPNISIDIKAKAQRYLLQNDLLTYRKMYGGLSPELEDKAALLVIKEIEEADSKLKLEAAVIGAGYKRKYETIKNDRVREAYDKKESVFYKKMIDDIENSQSEEEILRAINNYLAMVEMVNIDTVKYGLVLNNPDSVLLKPHEGVKNFKEVFNEAKKRIWGAVVQQIDGMNSWQNIMNVLEKNNINYEMVMKPSIMRRGPDILIKGLNDARDRISGLVVKELTALNEKGFTVDELKEVLVKYFNQRYVYSGYDEDRGLGKLLDDVLLNDEAKSVIATMIMEFHPSSVQAVVDKLKKESPEEKYIALAPDELSKAVSARFDPETKQESFTTMAEALDEKKELDKVVLTGSFFNKNNVNKINNLMSVLKAEMKKTPEPPVLKVQEFVNRLSIPPEQKQIVAEFFNGITGNDKIPVSKDHIDELIRIIGRSSQPEIMSYTFASFDYKVVIGHYESYRPFDIGKDQLLVQLVLTDKYKLVEKIQNETDATESFLLNILTSGHHDADVLCWARIAWPMKNNWVVVEMQSDMYANMANAAPPHLPNVEGLKYLKNMFSKWQDILFQEVKKIANAYVENLWMVTGRIAQQDQSFGRKRDFDVYDIKTDIAKKIIDKKSNELRRDLTTEETTVIQNEVANNWYNLSPIGRMAKQYMDEGRVKPSTVAEIKSQVERANKYETMSDEEKQSMLFESIIIWLLEHDEDFKNRLSYEQSAARIIYDMFPKGKVKGMFMETPKEFRRIEPHYDKMHKVFKFKNVLYKIASTLEELGCYDEADMIDNFFVDIVLVS